MALEVKAISWWDTLRLQAFLTLPATLWGFVAPNRRFVPWLARLDAAQHTARLLDDLRQKYGCEHFWIHFPLQRTLLVLDPESIDAVLSSDDNAADPPLKKNALAKAVPDALTISSGDEWRDRRRFNEEVLGFGTPHSHQEAFREVVFREVDQFAAKGSGELGWADFHTLGQRIAHQILFGAGRIEPEMASQLACMVGRSNWPFLPRDRRGLWAFYEQAQRYLGGNLSAGPQCLLRDSMHQLEAGKATATTRVPGQIGFWFFVLQDALELHVARTLALIAAHTDVQDRARTEVHNIAALSARAIDDLHELEACVGEQLRLWTPVPILLRRAVRPCSLRGEIAIESGQQIMIHAGHYHRDARVFGERADRFSPAAAGGVSPPVYFFSGHRQTCAGQTLARFLLKATLAALLARFRFELIGPALGAGRIPYSYDHFAIRLRAVADASLRTEPGVR